MPIYSFCFGFYWKRDARNLEVMKIKGLLEPARSCYGLGLHWFLGLAKSRYSWIQFMWIKFLLFLGSCGIRKLVHSSWWQLEKSLCGLKKGWAEVIRQTTLSAGCNISHNADCRNNYLLNARFLISWKRPLHLIFIKAATIVLNGISRLHIIWFSHINICVVTKPKRDKTTKKKQIASHECNASLFPVKIIRFFM